LSGHRLDEILNEFKALIEDANATGVPLVIQGGETKAFYGRKIDGTHLDIRPYTGVVSYEPTELVITARAGTRLKEVEQTLASEGQMLAFDPPYFGEEATLGGVIACGLSGPRRPYTGAVRDFVLGVRCLNGKGALLNFGGQVMKNVAGYDISRLMTGALGTLGVLLEITLKVLPIPEYEITLRTEVDQRDAIRLMNEWAGQPLPLSAACYDGEYLNIRLSGKESAVTTAMQKPGLEDFPDGKAYWEALREQRLSFFNDPVPLWRLSLPSSRCTEGLNGSKLIDWGGAQHWIKTTEQADAMWKKARELGGSATLFKGGDQNGMIFQPLTDSLLTLHRRLKQAFDPNAVLNPGRMYPEL
jgi:glycolate oxidase FAD binding subunit